MFYIRSSPDFNIPMLSSGSLQVIGGVVEIINFYHLTPRTGDIVPGTIANLCVEVAKSEVR